MVDTAKSSSAATGSSAGIKPTTAASGKTTTGGAAPKATHSASNIKTLAQTMEFRWFVAHASVVVSTVLSLVFFRAPKAANFFYRLGFVSAFASFVIILYQKYGKSKPSFSVLSHDDNFHYVVFTFLWLFTTRRILSLLPLAIFSLFHTLTYSRSYLLPALGRADTALTKRVDDLVKRYNEPLTVLAANFEIALAVQLVLLALTFAKGSWIQLVGYVAFIRLRYATSAYTRHALKAWEIRADQLLGHPALGSKAKQIWNQAKQYIAKIPGPANRA